MRLPLTVLALAGLLAGCGEGTRPNDDLTTLGDNGRAGEVLLRNVYVEPPADDRYSPGDDLLIRFVMVNSGERPDELVSAEVSTAQDTTVHWDHDCDGTAEAVDAIPLPPGTTGRDVGPPDERRRQPYHLAASGLTDLALAGTTLPVSFTFAQGGTVTVDALVAADKPRPIMTEYACTPDY